MKKPMSLAEQVREAQKVMSTWSDLHKKTVYLQGTDSFLSRKDGVSANPIKANSSGRSNQKSHA